MILDITKVIEQFDKQIRNELKTKLGYAIIDLRLKNTYEILQHKEYLKKKLIICESYISKQIFLKSINFTIEDWRKIRNESYYEELFLERGINKKLYKLAKIEEYINK